MATYVYNLKLLLVDTNDNIILDNDFLNEIKNKLCESNTKNIEWNMNYMKITLQWERKELNNIDKHFMGDLFLNSIYDSDSIVLNHTTQVISSVKNISSYKVKFFIFKLIGNKTICPDTTGLIY